ncbi:hypothetical protein ASG06_15245 [Rathayibacter sp. Leaf185]|nr:hypothetical protein ASF42_15245 [Rathayibacter sp. Leaf294]KQS10884.1 hypothetical protein ASG06_15245 [Rathayibacter sp. Leaf185]
MAQGPDIVSVLMAQATFNIRHSVDPNPQLAVLLAAIACEVHATQLIEATVDTADADTVRNFYKVANRAREPKEKYGKLAKALWSKSLEAEHPALWKHLVELFAVRHRIAHSGALVELEAGEPLVYQARLAIHWLTLISEGKDSKTLPMFPIV